MPTPQTDISRGIQVRKCSFDTVKAELRNGMLRLTAGVAKTTSKKVDVEAA